MTYAIDYQDDEECVSSKSSCFLSFDNKFQVVSRTKNPKKRPPNEVIHSTSFNGMSISIKDSFFFSLSLSFCWACMCLSLSTSILKLLLFEYLPWATVHNFLFSFFIDWHIVKIKEKKSKCLQIFDCQTTLEWFACCYY